MNAQTFSKSGAKATVQTKLNRNIFGIEVKNHELLKQAYLTYLANARSQSAKTKKRGEVRGGGRKPWRQKGTGRARFGSSRNPIWRGGGVAFGPTGNKNYRLKLSKQSKHIALKQALSLASEIGKIRIIESLEAKDAKTATVVKLLNKMNLEGNILIVVDSIDDNLHRATRNIPYVLLKKAQQLSVFDILNADCVVIAKKALEVIEEWLGDLATKRSKQVSGATQ